MPTVDTINRFTGRPALAAGVLILLAISALVVIPLNEKRNESGVERYAAEPVPSASDSGLAIERELPQPAPDLRPLPELHPGAAVGRSGAGGVGRREARIPSEEGISGRVDSWQDWNSSFSDTVTRTYSAIFDSARLDTLPGGLLAFSPSGRGQDFIPVKRIYCRIDSVRELVKYTFPGQSVSFNIGIAFAASVSFRGDLHPGERNVGLHLYDPAHDVTGTATEIVRNQFVVVLNSPTGYAYTLRTGIECAAGDGPGASTVYYTRPVIVEFRRMVRYESILGGAADTVYLLTGNPKAVTELSRALPGSFVNVVFVPRDDPHEADAIIEEARANVELYLSAPRVLDQSFLILNDSEALIEEGSLDPDFRHIAQLKTGAFQIDQVGHPRITHRTVNRAAVARMKLTHQRLRQRNP